MQQTLNVVHLLAKLRHTRLDILHVVGQALRLRTHGIDARAAICGGFLHAFLQNSHLGVQLVGGVQGLLHEGPQRCIIRVDRAAQIPLPLQKLSHLFLQLNHVLGNSAGGLGGEHRAAKSAD